MPVPSGVNHPHWRGGASEYPNHSLMKRNRLIILIKNNWKCEICGKRATQVHHKDGTKHNHNIENLCSICTRCHYDIHIGRKEKNSLYRGMYGLSITEIAEKLKKSPQRISELHHSGRLKIILNKISGV